MILLWVMGIYLLVYVVESWLSCLRLGTFYRKDKWFYIWDSLLSITPILTTIGLFYLNEQSARLSVVPIAFIGNIIGIHLSRQLRKSG